MSRWTALNMRDFTAVFSSNDQMALGLIHATFNASSELVDADSDWIRYTVTLALGLAAWAIYRRRTPTRAVTHGRAAGAGATR